jgi:pseudaminic acid cytidylyltransferase
VNKIICIIPARKGSKRIKNKNLKIFFGKPIIYHVIENLKRFNIFEKIIVSTNCNHIKNVAKKLNVEVLLRSEKLSDDITDTRTVIADAIKRLEKLNLNFNKVVCVYPTSIFFKINYLKLALKKLKKNTTYVFSAKKFEHSIFRSFYKTNNDIIKLNFKTNLSIGTQNLRQNYYDAAQFYLGWKNSWLSKKKIFNNKSDFVLLSSLASCDIDNYEDLKTAKILWKIKKNKNDTLN